MSLRAFLLLFLFFGMTACSTDRSNEQGPKQLTPRNESPFSATQTPAQAPAYKGDPELKKKLFADLEEIRTSNRNGSRSTDIQTLITELYSLCQTLGVTARALDHDGLFASDIDTELRRFRAGDEKHADEAGKVMNGMSGVYSMYALLAKMKFVGQADRQQEIQEIHDATIEALRPDAPAVEAAAAIAEACYDLSTMIIREIDTEKRYEKAFEQIDRQYQQGVRVAKKQEDLFINGMFRTFEVSQLWLLSIDTKASERISELNSGVSADSGEATNVGMQMGIAVKYLFLISYLIAQGTVNITT